MENDPAEITNLAKNPEFYSSAKEMFDFLVDEPGENSEDTEKGAERIYKQAICELIYKKGVLAHKELLLYCAAFCYFRNVMVLDASKAPHVNL